MTQSHQPTQQDWIARWQQVARRIRVPLGFVTAALYLFELWRRVPQPAAVTWSLALVLPGLWLRGYAAGYVKKNRELTQTGPYAHTRNPLYLGSMLIAAGFAVALLSWPVAAGAGAGLWGHLCAGYCFRRTLSAGHISRISTRIAARFRGSFRGSHRRSTGARRRRGLLAVALSQAPRVQCRYRGRTAVSQPVLPAACSRHTIPLTAMSCFNATKV